MGSVTSVHLETSHKNLSVWRVPSGAVTAHQSTLEQLSPSAACCTHAENTAGSGASRNGAFLGGQQGRESQWPGTAWGQPELSDTPELSPRAGGARHRDMDQHSCSLPPPGIGSIKAGSVLSSRHSRHQAARTRPCQQAGGLCLVLLLRDLCPQKGSMCQCQQQ